MNIYHDYDSTGKLYFYTDIDPDQPIGPISVEVREAGYNYERMWYFDSNIIPVIKAKDIRIYYGITIGELTNTISNDLKEWLPKKLVKGRKYIVTFYVNHLEYQGAWHFTYDPVIKESK